MLGSAVFGGLLSRLHRPLLGSLHTGHLANRLISRSETGCRSVGDQGTASDSWRLDPSRFPQRLDLELTAEVYEVLAAISERTGRSISEVAVEMLSRQTQGAPPNGA